MWDVAPFRKCDRHPGRPTIDYRRKKMRVNQLDHAMAKHWNLSYAVVARKSKSRWIVFIANLFASRVEIEEGNHPQTTTRIIVNARYWNLTFAFSFFFLFCGLVGSRMQYVCWLRNMRRLWILISWFKIICQPLNKLQHFQYFNTAFTASSNDPHSMPYSPRFSPKSSPGFVNKLRGIVWRNASAGP